MAERQFTPNGLICSNATKIVMIIIQFIPRIFSLLVKKFVFVSFKLNFRGFFLFSFFSNIYLVLYMLSKNVTFTYTNETFQSYGTYDFSGKLNVKCV